MATTSKTRIPHLKTSIPQRVQQHQTRDPTVLHASFTTLGAPLLSVDDFTRLCHGPLGDALVFLSEHIKGRQGAALARNKIQTLRQTHTKSELKLPSNDPTRSDEDRAASRLSSANKAVETYQKQLDERQAAVLLAQAELEKLKGGLDAKHRVKLLLGVLERKESIRVKRFKEVVRLLDNLRKAVAESKCRESSVMPQLEAAENKLHSTSLPVSLRPTYARDTLSTLHAHHIRLSQLISRSNEKDTNSSLSTLQTSIARHLNVIETDAEVAQFLNKFIDLARKRAEQNVRYHSAKKATSPGPSTEVLEAMVDANKNKEQELQKLSDLSMALMFLSEHFTKSIVRFLKTTLPAVRSSIDEEASQAKGYVDVLRWHVFSAGGFREAETRGKSFVQEVKSTCRMKGNLALNRVLEQVNDVIQSAHQRELFLHSTAVLPPVPLTTEQATLISSYEDGARQAQEQMIKLLTRKVDKAKMGESLVKDVETLIREARFISREKD